MVQKGNNLRQRAYTKYCHQNSPHYRKRWGRKVRGNVFFSYYELGELCCILYAYSLFYRMPSWSKLHLGGMYPSWCVLAYSSANLEEECYSLEIVMKWWLPRLCVSFQKPLCWQIPSYLQPSRHSRLPLCNEQQIDRPWTFSYIQHNSWNESCQRWASLSWDIYKAKTTRQEVRDNNHWIKRNINTHT